MRLLHETATAIYVRHQVSGQDLDGHFAAQARVARAIHLAHASSPDEGEDLVNAESRTRVKGHVAWRCALWPAGARLVRSHAWTTRVRCGGRGRRPPLLPPSPHHYSDDRAARSGAPALSPPLRLQGQRARKDVVVTTSAFSSEARQYAERIDAGSQRRSHSAAGGNRLPNAIASFAAAFDTGAGQIDGTHNGKDSWPRTSPVGTASCCGCGNSKGLSRV